MKFDSLLKSNHDLKKNGYKILRKLHKLENRANLSKAYGASCSKGCFVVLSCKELADIISDMYGSYDEQYIKSFYTIQPGLLIISNLSLAHIRELILQY